MAPTHRAENEPLIATLFRFAPGFDFFQAVRIAQAAAPDLPRVGTARRPDEEIVDFLQRPSLSFIPSPLVGLRLWTFEPDDVLDAAAVWRGISDAAEGTLALVRAHVGTASLGWLAKVLEPRADPAARSEADLAWMAALKIHLDQQSAWCPGVREIPVPASPKQGVWLDGPSIARRMVACELNRVLFTLDLVTPADPTSKTAVELGPRVRGSLAGDFGRTRRNRLILEDLLAPALRRLRGLRELPRGVLEVRGLGLFGSNGPLPLWLTEFAFHQQAVRSAQIALGDMRHAPGYERDPMWTESGIVALAHMVQSRMIAALYRAWDQSQKVTLLDRPGPHPFRYCLDALLGLLEIDRASEDRSTAAGLSDNQVRDIRGFLRRLALGESEVAAHLWKALGEELQGEVRSFLSGKQHEEGVRRKVLVRINEFLGDGRLDDRIGFAGTQLSDVAQERLHDAPHPRGVVGLNRLLLEDAFAEELSPAPYSGMADGIRYYAGQVLGIRRTAAGLTAILESELGVRVEVLEFVGRWVAVPDSHRLRVGRPRAGAAVSSAEMVCGRRIWDAQNHFRLRVGPLTQPSLEDLLPGRALHRLLTDWVEVYLGDELSWDLQLVVRKDEVPELRTGKALRLGWTSWLPCRSHPRERDADDLILRRPSPLDA